MRAEVSKIVRVPTPSSNSGSPPALSQSPLWTDLLDDVATRICGQRQIKPPRGAALEQIASAVARAHARLLIALERPADVGERTVSQLSSEAAQLLVCVASVAASFGASRHDRRSRLAVQLRERMASHEEAVLAGEITYGVWSEQAEKPASGMRRAIRALSHDPCAASALRSLELTGIELTSLLVRLAANARASRNPREAPEPRSATLQASLEGIVGELAAAARQLDRPLNKRADAVAQHLAANLNLLATQRTSHDLPAETPRDPTQHAAIAGMRNAWVALASNEYAAVAVLNAQLHPPTDSERAGTVPTTVAEVAADVICGARLAGRPTAFRHCRAWRYQAEQLSNALPSYLAGLSGHRPSLAQAQIILLTRLIRATVAIAMIDLSRAQFPFPV